MEFLTLEAKSHKGKNRIAEAIRRLPNWDGKTWRVMQEKKRVSFSTDPGPWAHVTPNTDENTDWCSRWVNLHEDDNFTVTANNASLSAAPPLPNFKERVQALRERYPYQFTRTFSLSIEHGWLPIIESVCEQIDAALEEANIRKQNFSFLQIKEKLGGLRLAWDRAWNVPEGSLPLCDEPALIFPDSIPEDPQYDECKQTIEEYLASPRAREWDAMHMIPNPALANTKRDSSRHFERLMSVDFEEGVSEEEMDLVTQAIARAVMVPEDVTQRIREIIDAAEQQASITCQFCGAPGNRKQLDGDGWIVVGCEKHGTRKAIVEFNRQFENERGSSEHS